MKTLIALFVSTLMLMVTSSEADAQLGVDRTPVRNSIQVVTRQVQLRACQARVATKRVVTNSVNRAKSVTQRTRTSVQSVRSGLRDRVQRRVNKFRSRFGR